MYSNQTWSDIRDLYISPKKNNHTAENIQKLDKPTIVEATGFRSNQNGDIELVASQNISLMNKQVSGCNRIDT
ncbi:MAG: hypothetical protein AAFQ91_24465 [Cyanobacteria bacterium J06621_15]